MLNRRYSPLTAAISLVLIATITAQAGPVNFGEVIHMVGNPNSGNTSQSLRLRHSPDDHLLTGGPLSGDPGATETTGEPASLIETTEVDPQQGPGGIETIEQGEISGTICDCGEIAVKGGGGFPLWPLLGLGVIPFFFIRRKKTCQPPDTRCTPPPPCTPDNPDCNPNPVPEPASLLLLGSGLAALGASARRRYRRNLEAKQNVTTTEV